MNGCLRAMSDYYLSLPRQYDKTWLHARLVDDVILVRLSVHILDVARVALVFLFLLQYRELQKVWTGMIVWVPLMSL